MSKPNDGGAAFPSGLADGRNGVSLRDYFAAKVMAAVYTSCNTGAGPFPFNGERADFAEECYLIADAMLAARGVK